MKEKVNDINEQMKGGGELIKMESKFHGSFFQARKIPQYRITTPKRQMFYGM